MYIVEDFAHEREDYSCRRRPLIWDSGDVVEHRHSDDDWCDCGAPERRHRHSDNKRKQRKQTHDYYLHDWDDHMHKHDCQDWDDHMHKQGHCHHDWDNHMHYLHERGEHMHKHDHFCCEREQCNGSACEQLKDLARNTPILFSTGDAPQLLSALFISYDSETCYVTLRIGTADAYVDCRDIKVLIIA